MSSKMRVFVASENISDGKAIITGGDALHISKVMRLGIGDVITVCDMQRNVYDGEIISVLPETVVCSLTEVSKCNTELPCRVTVYQGIPKGDKLETVIQKSVELGAFRIVPVLCDRCVSRPDKKGASSKNARYNKISASAACQCGREIIPQVSLMISFDEMIEEMINNEGLSFVCFEGEEKTRVKDLLGDEIKDISFFIGPEGGISEREIQAINKANVPTVTLGKRILRTETAPLFVLSAISVLWE